MRQISLADASQVDEVFPSGRRCRHLDLTEESASMDGEAFVLGRCRLYGGRAIEQGCISCIHFGEDRP